MISKKFFVADIFVDMLTLSVANIARFQNPHGNINNNTYDIRAAVSLHETMLCHLLQRYEDFLLLFAIKYL